MEKFKTKKNISTSVEYVDYEYLVKKNQKQEKKNDKRKEVYFTQNDYIKIIQKIETKQSKEIKNEEKNEEKNQL